MTKEQIDSIKSYTWLDLAFQELRMERLYTIYTANKNTDAMENDIANLLVILKLLNLRADIVSR